MPFIPHRQGDIELMHQTLGISATEQLFDEIDPSLKAKSFKLPQGLSELEMVERMQTAAQQNASLVCFAGAGAYDHHIAAAAWDIALRGENYSAYTPYQAEASQGTLQTIFEFQTLICRINALEASNASLYDGASALGEAVLMAARVQKKIKQHRILVPRSLLPNYRDTLLTMTQHQDIQLIEVDFDRQTGRLADSLADYSEAFTALVIPQPNAFGVLEDVAKWTHWAHGKNALVIALVNPLLATLITPAGQWGEQGADIAVGDGQPLGLPLSYGGPYYGFMATKMDFVRQMPGRIVGKTQDTQGRTGYTLTLQAREQHIRRGKATSNICSNQGLMVTASTIHMSLMGGTQLRRQAQHSLAKRAQIQPGLVKLAGVEGVFNAPHAHEFLVRLPMNVADFIQDMAQHGILAGVDMSQTYPELGQVLLVTTTEKRSDAQIAAYLAAAATVLGV